MKTSEVANLVFQWIFVLNSAKHKFFPVSKLLSWRFDHVEKTALSDGKISLWHHTLVKKQLQCTYCPTSHDVKAIWWFNRI